MDKTLILTFIGLLLLTGAVGAGDDFKDDFAKRPNLYGEKKGYAIWGSGAQILKAAGYDPETGCQAPGSLKIDGSKMPQKGSSSALFVKSLPVEPGCKYNLMLKVLKKELAGTPMITGRIIMTGEKNSRKVPMRQVRLDPHTFEDGTWTRMLVAIEIPSREKLAETPRVTIQFGVQNLKGGTVWFDDVEFFKEENQ